MQIQVNAAHNIEGHETLSLWANDAVKTGLDRQSEHIMQVEVHLADENGGKSGPNDKRCTMEAHLSGRPPLAVTHHSATLRAATAGAMEKITRMIDTTLGKLLDQKRHAADLSPTRPTPREEY